MSRLDAFNNPEECADAQPMLHELDAHQMEPKQQNEELRLVQVELDALRAHYFALYDQAPVGYFTLSEVGLILEANHTSAFLLDVAWSKLPKQPISRFILDEDLDIYHRLRKQIFRTGAPQSGELRMIKNDGTPFWAQMEFSSAHDDEGMPLCHIVMNDITERKCIVQERDQYCKFFQLSIDPMCMIDSLGCFMRVNLAFMQTTGFEESELMAKSILEFIQVKDRRRTAEIMKQQTETSRPPACFSNHFVRKDGGIILLSWKACFDEYDGVVYATARDITQTAQTENRLDQERIRLRKILKMASDGIHILDADGRLVEANDAFLNMLGYDDSVIGKMRVSDWDMHISGTTFQKNLEHLVNGGVLAPFETRHRRRDGTILHVEINSSAVEFDGKNFIYAASRDISIRKRAEEQLLEITAVLEEQVNIRISRLRALSAQLTMTEERERRLLAQELHDNLCQILAVIKIKLTSLIADEFQSSVDHIVELVSRADHSARTITRELSPPTLRALGLIPALEWLAKDKIPPFDLGVHFECVGEMKPLEEWVQAVLYRSVRELLINVAKHAKVSEASLSCRSNESQLILVVCDDGCGFDPINYQNGLPERNGYGLSSIYERLTNIGGEMAIDSRPGHGARITLTIPYSNATKGTPSS